MDSSALSGTSSKEEAFFGDGVRICDIPLSPAVTSPFSRGTMDFSALTGTSSKEEAFFWGGRCERVRRKRRNFFHMLFFFKNSLSKSLYTGE